MSHGTREGRKREGHVDDHQGQGLHRGRVRASARARRPTSPSPQLHAEVAQAARSRTPGSTKDDVDGYFCAGDAPGLGRLSMADYMGLKRAPRGLHRDRRLFLHRSTSGTPPRRSPQGKCKVALITLAGRPAHGGHGHRHRASRDAGRRPCPRRPFENPYGGSTTATSTACAPCATCTSTAPPASSSPGSRSPPRTTPSATRTPCCATSSPSRTWSIRG